MKLEALRKPTRLEKGQLWKLENGYLYIVEPGKRLVHYKLLRQPNQKAVVTRLIGMEELLTYLKHNEAQMIEDTSMPAPAVLEPAVVATECQFC
jgi:hypothetical protein